ncbi:uncharacterized protein LOC121377502 isoform X2 [Gigantopelta aegis]|uniref:uncharacterized protein LOC121377502 isoform X2 n=1 Tax=Gigantopelta aegis TaxID=1735272 RepID=UPI001B889D3F|nr:uncharacterized protein LOC121377502 isoform X2 [Gigantopelta aegis]
MSNLEVSAERNDLQGKNGSFHLGEMSNTDGQENAPNKMSYISDEERTQTDKTLKDKTPENVNAEYNDSATNSPDNAESNVLSGNDSSDEELEQDDSSESEEFSDFDSEYEDMFNIVIPNHPPPLPYPHNPFVDGECNICLVSKKLRKRMCCSFPVCEDCMEMYLSTQVSQAIVKIECLNTECNNYVHRDEILARLPLDLKEKFYKFLIDANKDPKIKTCPRCSHVTRLEDCLLKMNGNISSKKQKQYKKYLKRVKKKSLEVKCDKCELEWCFTCQAPLHKGVNCKTFKKGDQLVKMWASEFHYGQQNAQRCPKCKIFIQRTTGCDHMTCVSCRTSFCYRCGNRYWSVKLLGDHFSRFSPFGCRYNFMPDRPGTRRLVRGAVFSGKILGGIVLGGVAIAAGAGLLGVSVVALPIIGGYYLRKKYLKNKRLRTTILNENTDQNEPARSSLEPAVVEDSGSYNADFPEWLVVGVQLPNSRQVEVLVHRSVSSGEAEQAHVYKTEITHPEDGSVQDGGIVTVTEVEEVMNEDGSTRVIAHIVTKPANSDPSKKDQDGPEDQGHARKDSRISIDGKGLKVESDGKVGIAGFTEDEDDVVAIGVDREMMEDVGDEAGTNETNGCFVNIFAKRLNSFHSAASTDAQDVKPPKTLLKSKSGTWEKSKKKEAAHYTNSLDIRSLSAIMAAHCTDRDVKGQRMKNSGMFDHLEANVHADESGESCLYDDEADWSTTDPELSCDIVTYL